MSFHFDVSASSGSAIEFWPGADPFGPSALQNTFTLNLFDNTIGAYSNLWIIVPCPTANTTTTAPSGAGGPAPVNPVKVPPTTVPSIPAFPNQIPGPPSNATGTLSGTGAAPANPTPAAPSKTASATFTTVFSISTTPSTIGVAVPTAPGSPSESNGANPFGSNGANPFEATPFGPNITTPLGTNPLGSNGTSSPSASTPTQSSTTLAPLESTSSSSSSSPNIVVIVVPIVAGVLLIAGVALRLKLRKRPNDSYSHELGMKSQYAPPSPPSAGNYAPPSRAFGGQYASPSPGMYAPSQPSAGHYASPSPALASQLASLSASMSAPSNPPRQPLFAPFPPQAQPINHRIPSERSPQAFHEYPNTQLDHEIQPTPPISPRSPSSVTRESSRLTREFSTHSNGFPAPVAPTRSLTRPLASGPASPILPLQPERIMTHQNIHRTASESSSLAEFAPKPVSAHYTHQTELERRLIEKMRRELPQIPASASSDVLVETDKTVEDVVPPPAYTFDG
ncbi:hypothetical protein BDK51DRAFT_50177 [Blyttiomyces helicus]|uniref:Uncharacterized protein n=1 Tax=Blyttiomyces helicus TaxID=388810 RepID=A0A4P9VZH0_9FUNG|nr:hypothetical protein BDK51DRAFT_50177 [Blyttiomyces helicus]|eukprot:RKO83216.1 hypothetical protein BDK51DRAFT_50177 [Blyttiomyces helicus]